MAQTGFTPIQLYSSSTTGNTPAAADLLNSSGGSELAINIFDGKLFYKDSSGNVQVIGWKVVPVSAGGTGQTSYTDGQLLIGNSTGNTLTKATLTAGTGITITNGSGAITINGTGGTVTSVAALTLGTTGTDLSSTVANGTTTPVITLNVPTASATNRGALSAADWTTFNSKYSVGGALGTPSSGTVTNLTGTASININGTVGATTPNTVASTTLNANTYFTVSVGGSAGVQDVASIGTSGNGGAGRGAGIILMAAGSSSSVNAARIVAYQNTASATANNAALAFQVADSGTAALTERMRIGPSGGVSIGNTTDPGATNLSVTGAVALASLFGVSYAQTSTAAGTSIIDTGISIPTGGAVSAAYLAVFSANANVGGNGNYRGNGIYLINISSDYAGGNQVYQIKQTKLSFGPSGPFSIELTLAASSWNGTTDTTTPLWSSANQQLRVKIAGFTGTVGSYLDFKLIKLL